MACARKHLLSAFCMRLPSRSPERARPPQIQAIVCAKTNDTQVWSKAMADGSTVLLLLNRADKASRDITAPFAQCVMHGSTSRVAIREVW